MKKTVKGIIKAILIIVLIIIAIYVTYEKIILPRLPGVRGIIVAKDDKTITLKSSVDSTERSCILKIEKNPIIKDVGGRKIDISDLNIGDKIHATYGREGEVEMSMYATNPPTYSDIKFIQVEESNQDKHIPEEELTYNKFIITKFEFENNYITLNTYMLDDYPYDYLSGNCRIVKKGINDQDTEEKIIDSTQISLKKRSDHDLEININFDTYNLINELKTGKYIFIFESDELGLIKIPFEKIRGGIISNHN